MKKMRDIKPIFYIYQIYKYIILFPIICVSTLIFGSLAAFLAMIAGPKVGTVMGVIWARIVSIATPMFVKVTGKENIVKGQSYIVVANHQSQYDILVIYGWLPIDFRWIMKIELRKIPVLGYACYKLGHVYIDRTNTDAAMESMNKAKNEVIKNGTSIFFFPEGTRSSDGKLINFKAAAFRFALDMNLPILPVTIVGTRDIMPSNSLAIFPGKTKLIIHEPIDISKYELKDILLIRNIARNSIQKGLDQN